jgi:signal transduction histidine kinase
MEKKLKIIHLEDDLNDAELARLALEDDGIDCELVVVSDQEQFATALAAGGFDLVLSAYALPAFDGLTALQMTRERYPNIPFIFLSGVIGEERAIESLKSGATDYVLKGRLVRLGPTVRRAIKSQEDELALWQVADLMRVENERFRILSNEFKTLLDAIPDRISLRAPDFKLLWANTVANDALHWGEDFVGRHCYEAFHNKMVHCEGCPAVESFQSGEIATAIMTTPDKRIWEVRSLPICEPGEKVVSVIEIVRDISEHRRLEDRYFQAQKLETVGTLASGIAHDFNNILTCISGYGQMLSRKMPEDDPLRNYVDIILNAASRAAKLTGELLHFSNRQPCEQKPLDLNSIITTAEKFFSKMISENIEIKINLYPQPLHILADRNHLEQVLMNLTINADHAMDKFEKGCFTVTTAAVTLKKNETSCPPGDYALLTIADTGEGMDLTTQQRIFEPFFTTKEIGKGSGLGLAVAYGIIKQHGGTITLTSEKNKGTTFRIYLPLITTDIESESDPDAEESHLGGTETILLAEDDKLVRSMTKSFLLDFGYSVLEVENGEDAVKIFTKNQNDIDLLLFDLIMPKMNGYEACMKIQKLRPDIKALIASGYLPQAQEIKGVLGRHVFIIEKPYSPETLLQRVRNLLDMTP